VRLWHRLKLRYYEVVLYSIVTENVAMEKKVFFGRMINCEQIDVSEVSGNHINSSDPI